MVGSDECIKLGYTDGKVLGTILGNAYLITLGIDVGTELDSLDVSFYCSNVGKIEGGFIRDSIISTGVKVLGSD